MTKLDVPSISVSVYECKTGVRREGVVIPLPKVFKTPIRSDLVSFVVSQMNNNTRQAHGVKYGAGYGTAAASWGTGRAVSRVPRVPGGGTNRAGQGAFANFCRGGGMFGRVEIWRRWHRRINLKMKRYAVASAVAASGCPALVMARGHRIQATPEFPLVVDNGIESIKKTKEATKCLQALGLTEDVLRASRSKRLRPGVGKYRNRRYIVKRGPMLIYNKDDGVTRAFRNIPGVSLCSVERLGLLKLAPGGHLGRMCIWSESAFKKLSDIYGSRADGKTTKKDFWLPRGCLQNADIDAIVNSDPIQMALKPPQISSSKSLVGNPAKSVSIRESLCPGYRRKYEHQKKLAAEMASKKKAKGKGKGKGKKEKKEPKPRLISKAIQQGMASFNLMRENNDSSTIE